MRATGIVRQVDRLGRIVIPMEIRKKFDMIDDEKGIECPNCHEEIELEFDSDEEE